MDATFFALVALIIFLGVVIYFKAPQMLTGSLDKRAARIADELEEARKLREEAQALLAEYQRKQRDAEKEAADIIAAAETNAARMTEEAKLGLEDLIARRTKMAETKITQAEAQALQDVRSIAADAAISAAERILSAKMSGKAADSQISDSIAEVKSRLQ
ncbi:MAG: ATP F0F1 synthase subunit B [Rhodobiaceae bacterium]|nr:ATP F0F1 synthase subunit B [Rhodobiaceae bacterium]MCC0018843.1 ATP F0F1 synthase subunit B [Rhodobiaceae bacterium]MCC0050657.1 ATP F0F1 synthase subunit B [Rhodobiaceae bacterium]MCC0059860.1 ATP F0F1 synthase subunit B [Rhodobiaceae bacterium]